MLFGNVGRFMRKWMKTWNFLTKRLNLKPQKGFVRKVRFSEETHSKWAKMSEIWVFLAKLKQNGQNGEFYENLWGSWRQIG